MAGDIRAKERAALALVSSGGSLSNGTAVAAGVDFDARASGNAADDFAAQFGAVMQWASVSGIVAGTIAAELYLVPALDGATFPDVNLSSGVSRIPFACLAGVFELPVAPTANTNYRMVTRQVDLMPVLYRAYLLNRSGQTIAAGWTLSALSAQAQYT